VYADWIAAQEKGWLDAIRVAALDPFRGYSTALCTQIPDATRVLDACHVVALAVRVVDEVRRRVQQDTTGTAGTRTTRSATSSCVHLPPPRPARRATASRAAARPPPARSRRSPG
jgi:transposase